MRQHYGADVREAIARLARKLAKLSLELRFISRLPVVLGTAVR